MSALDDAIGALEHLGGRIDACGSAAEQAVEATSDALDAAAAFGLPADVDTLERLHDDLADAAGTLTACGEQRQRALDRLIAMRGDQAGGGSGPASRGPRRRNRRRAPGAVNSRRPAPQGDAGARRRAKGRRWRSWGDPDDHVAAYVPKLIGYSISMAGFAGMTRSVVAGVAAITGGFAVDVAATMYQNAKAARRERERGN